VVQLQVVEWNAWERFMITHILPDAQCITATPGAPLSALTMPSAPALIHVNLSRPRTVFPDYSDWLRAHEEAGRPVLNGYCRSIDKWAVQEACAAAGLPQVRARRDGDPDELVIIKSRANHCGLYEQTLPEEMTGDMTAPPWPYPERIHKLRRREVPEPLWTDRRIAIERFVSNASGRYQRAYVAGDYAAVVTAFSPDLVKQINQRHVTEMISDDAAASRPADNRDPLSVTFRLARAMQADFAALDLALDEDGAPHPIDLNTTPSWGEETDLNPRLIGEMREAFEPLLRAGSPHGRTASGAAGAGQAGRFGVATA